MSLKKRQSIESFIYTSMKIGLFISICMLGMIRLFHIKNVVVIKTGLIAFILDVILLSAWMVLGTIFRWKSFTMASKRLDLERHLGGIGSIIYVVFGIFCSLVMVYLLFHVLRNDLGQLGTAFSIRK